jgi:small neutral amino acid transporter SnatA (MarC family)
MDDQQHALAGLLRTIPIARAGEGSSSKGSSDPGDDAPSGWLWAAALVLALNPARATFAIPRAGRSRRTVVGVAAVGGVIGGLAVCAAATAGGPLLEALDVSEPSFRISAGIVAGLAGAADLFRRPPPPEPALAGWRAALIPVAIPVVARPALLVLALGAGADRGVLVSAGAMAMGIALLTGLAAGWPTEGPGGRALRWAGRLLAAGLVACGVILAVDGVVGRLGAASAPGAHTPGWDDRRASPPTLTGRSHRLTPLPSARRRRTGRPRRSRPRRLRRPERCTRWPVRSRRCPRRARSARARAA